MLYQKSNRIIIRDTTLREGLQVPGVKICLKDKIKIIKLIELIGIPEIEIGLPGGIEVNRDLAEYIFRRNLSIKTSALIPCYISDWKMQIEKAKKYNFSKVYITVPTSDILLKNYSTYRMRKNNIVPQICKCIEYAKIHNLEVGVGFIDATRTEKEFLSELCQKIKCVGLTEAIIYDTAGVCLPESMFEIIYYLHKKSSLQFFVHCHNDYGLATANSLAALRAGAVGIEVAVNGLGGRSGNASLEEVVLAVKNLYKIDIDINTLLIKKLSNLVEKKSGIKCSPLKPIIGKFSFVHVPLMHICCVASGNRSSFEPFEPRQVGSERRYSFSLPIDYRKAIEPFFERLRISPREDEIKNIFSLLKEKSAHCGLSEKEVIKIIRKNKNG